MATSASARAAVELLLDRIGDELELLAGALSGLDAKVFTAHAGPQAQLFRASICRRVARLGLDLDRPRMKRADHA